MLHGHGFRREELGMTFFSWLGSFVNLGANLTDTEKIFNRLNDDEKRRLSDEFIYSVGMGVSRFF